MDRRGNLHIDSDLAIVKGPRTERDALLDALELVDIPREEIAKVRRMNRRQRRAWYAEKRRLARKAK